jgi:hypothetical protein
MDIPRSSGPNMFPVDDLGIASCDPYILMIHADGTPTDAGNVAVVIGLERNARSSLCVRFATSLRSLYEDKREQVNSV